MRKTSTVSKMVTYSLVSGLGLEPQRILTIRARLDPERAINKIISHAAMIKSTFSHQF
jgi:hypothetical protein